MALMFDRSYSSDEAIWTAYYEYAYSLTEGKLPEVVDIARRFRYNNPDVPWEEVIKLSMKEAGCKAIPSQDDFDPMFVIITSDVDFSKKV